MTVIVLMEPSSTAAEVDHVTGRLDEIGTRATVTRNAGRVVIVADGSPSPESIPMVRALTGVADVVAADGHLRLTTREFRSADTVVDVADRRIGDGSVTVCAGPCAVETADQVQETAHAVARSGAAILRGGAFKPRTSPYSFQGLGWDGLDMLAEEAGRVGMPTVTEVLEPGQVAGVAEHSDMLQIGTRNMQNFPLLREAGRTDRPVLLKRGFAATVEEWLGAAEYVLREGNDRVVLCERGVRTFEPTTRFTLDVSAIPVVKKLSHLPVIVDPSHSAGRAWLVRPLALAAVAAGADGLLVDVHPDSANARCDADQALTPTEFDELMDAVRAVGASVGRPVLPREPRVVDAVPTIPATVAG
jgi:3-deoxy-7-phosphoheptulonate synthase